jgi:WXXGXW repeat (2 copies)
MKTKLVVAMLLAGSSLFAETHFSIGIGVGGRGYAAAPVVAYAQPPCPGPGYTWTAGYWDQSGPRRFWRDGYWAAPVYNSGYQASYGFDRDRHDGDRDDRRTYGNSYNVERSRFTANQSQNRSRDNRDSSQYNNGFVRH